MTDSKSPKDGATAPTPPEPPKLRRTLRNDATELSSTHQTIEEFLERHGVRAEVVFAVSLAFEEVVTNIIKYAYEDQSAHEVALEVTVLPEQAVLRVSDDGREFNPLLAPKPELGGPLEERPIGGLGVHIVKEMANSMEYARHEGLNVLTVSYSLSP